MAGIVINKERCTLCQACIKICPFKALEIQNNQVCVNASCKMCRACLKVCPFDAISVEQEVEVKIDKTLYNDILVYVEHTEGKIHPVTLELVGKALELAKVIHQQVNCLFIGSHIEKQAESLLEYGVHRVYVYDDPALEYFRSDNYANVFEDCINQTSPTVVLVGATVTGRSLAPRVATRFRTGLTADCTVLEMRENTDLVQIRPAFGGNIMAQILNTNHRPQFATVRYKVMEHALKAENPAGQIVRCEVTPDLLKSKIDILQVEEAVKQVSIEEADILVVAGSGVKDERGMKLIQELASKLNALVGVTRPLVENGMASVYQQIGLSGRTVKPKLILTFGVSGAIQFVAGMNASETIIAVNSDPHAPIFNTAHYAVVGDLYEILPSLISKLEGGHVHDLQSV